MLKSATQQNSIELLSLGTQTSTSNQSNYIFKSLFDLSHPLRGTGGLQLEFIPYSFYRGYAIDAEFLTDLPDMNIDGAITNDHIIAPNLAQDLIAQENATGTRSEQVK